MNDMIDFFMDPLRLTLIIAGVVVLLAIIIFSRRSGKRKDFTYTPTASKEFSFGSQDLPSGEEHDKDVLIGDDYVGVARTKTASQSVEPEIPSVSTTDKMPLDDQPGISANAYNVRTEPKKSPKQASTKTTFKTPGKVSEKTKVNEFQAYQPPVVDEPIKNDVFDEDGIGAVRVVKTTKTQDAQPVSSKVEAAKPATAKETSKDSSKFYGSVKTSTPVGKASKNQTDNVTARKPAPAKASANTSSVEKPAAKERFIVLHVIATEGKPFNGLDILESTKTLGLAFGKHAIFHYPMSAAPAGDSKFCLVNMSAEGNFETNKLSSLETNGVSLIMRLPIRGADALTVFSNMLGVAQALARKLGGEILDQTRMPLTAEIVSSIRADIAQFENSLKPSTSKEPVPEV